MPRVVDFETTACALRRIHRDIGSTHQCIRIIAVLRVDGDADACAHIDEMAVDRQRLGQHLEDLMRHEFALSTPSSE